MNCSILTRAQVSSQDYVRARPQIETILLRASAMLQGGGEMVLWTEAGTKPLLVPALESPGFWNLTGTLGHNAFLVGSAAEGGLSQIPPRPPNQDLCSALGPLSYRTTLSPGAGRAICCRGKNMGPLGLRSTGHCQVVRLGPKTEVRLVFSCALIVLTVRTG